VWGESNALLHLTQVRPDGIGDCPVAGGVVHEMLIMDDSPLEFDVDVNDTYSKERPLATMPPNILLTLPDLPRDIEYRFVGRRLILRDVRANIIIDEIPRALECTDCAPRSDEH
jgi:hypothetical protein